MLFPKEWEEFPYAFEEIESPITPSITPQSRYHSGRVIDVIDVIDVFNLLEFYLCGAQNNNLNP